MSVSRRPAAASAAESASGNETPWWSKMREPPCSRPSDRATVSSRSRHIAPTQRAAIPQPLLGEPRALQLLATADPADHVVLGDLDVAEADRRVSLGIAVGVRGVIDDLHPAAVAIDDEQGREPLRTVDYVRHHHVDAGDVARGDEPLLGVEADPAAVRSAVATMADGSEPASRSVTA